MKLVNDFQPSESIKLSLSNEQMTHDFGRSLAISLYSKPVTILLEGPVGAGKTTLLKGLGLGLGIEEEIISPTFALEQRYNTKIGVPFLHIDLYRLSEAEAAHLLLATEDHEGIRCIEWSDRHSSLTAERTIKIRLAEEGEGRSATVTFSDMPLPIDSHIEQWREGAKLPAHIVSHCDIVGGFSEQLAQYFVDHGQAARPLALKRAGQLHDLLRFLDFRDGAGPKDVTYEEQDFRTWSEWKKRYPGQTHEQACVHFLQEQGLPELAQIIEKHGFKNPPTPDATVEQKILYYADKRCTNDRVVTLDERFADFAVRYGNGKRTSQQEEWYRITKRVEGELFPDGVPL